LRGCCGHTTAGGPGRASRPRRGGLGGGGPSKQFSPLRNQISQVGDDVLGPWGVAVPRSGPPRVKCGDSFRKQAPVPSSPQAGRFLRCGFCRTFLARAAWARGPGSTWQGSFCPFPCVPDAATRCPNFAGMAGDKQLLRVVSPFVPPTGPSLRIFRRSPRFLQFGPSASTRGPSDLGAAPHRWLPRPNSKPQSVAVVSPNRPAVAPPEAQPAGFPLARGPLLRRQLRPPQSVVDFRALSVCGAFLTLEVSSKQLPPTWGPGHPPLGRKGSSHRKPHASISVSVHA